MSGARLLGLLAALLVAPGSALALGVGDVAGQLDGEPVTLGEVDDALGGEIRRHWREIDTIVRDAARAICQERALARKLAAAGVEETDWRAQIWLESALQSGDPATLHAARVREYRAQVQRASEQALAGAFALKLPPADDAPRAEPVLPPIVASCMDGTITREQLERFAAFPLYRRRAGVVAMACWQFEMDYSNPLVLHRIAEKRGISVEELMRSVETQAPPVPEEKIEALARERYGDAGPASREKVRLALAVARRVEDRMAYVERLRRETRGTCVLERPPDPVVELRGEGERSAERPLRVVYFGSFRCQHCASGWATLRALRDRFGARIAIELRHHFPELAWPPFRDALAAQCAARAGRLRDHVDARYTAPPACLDDPTTAVEVLSDTEEALRLGFREALPSWVIGRRPRRGAQSERILAATISAELASW